MVETLGSTAVRIRDHFGQRADAASKIVSTAGSFAAEVEKTGNAPSAEHIKQAREMLTALDHAGSNLVIAGLAAGIDEGQVEKNLNEIERASERVSKLVARM